GGGMSSNSKKLAKRASRQMATNGVVDPLSCPHFGVCPTSRGPGWNGLCGRSTWGGAYPPLGSRVNMVRPLYRVRGRAAVCAPATTCPSGHAPDKCPDARPTISRTGSTRRVGLELLDDDDRDRRLRQAKQQRAHERERHDGDPRQ